MSTASGLHHRALDLARRIGQPMTITHTVSEYDPTTGVLLSSSTTTMTGSASPDDQDHSELYQALGLTAQRAVTFLFTPDTFGQRPSLGGTLTYAGAKRTINHVSPVDLDGNVITSRVTAST